MYGIPTMKLSKKVVQRRLDLMAAEGIVFKTGVNIGSDVSAQQIKDENDALLLCMGATWPRDLPIEGRSSSGFKIHLIFSNKIFASLQKPIKDRTKTIISPLLVFHCYRMVSFQEFILPWSFCKLGSRNSMVMTLIIFHFLQRILM